MAYNPKTDCSIAKTHGQLEIKKERIDELNAAYASVTDDYTAIFNVEVSDDTGCKYQWFIRYPKDVEDNIDKWHYLEDETTNKLIISSYKNTPYRLNGAQFVCKISNSIGETFSEPATLTVIEATSVPEITTQPTSLSDIDPAELTKYADQRYAEYGIMINN